jgi:PPOX class probable F420-dependent enzyme
MATTTIELNDAQKALLDEKHYGVVTDLNPDGSPHSTLIWVDHDGSNLVFNTGYGRLKTRNVERDPRVSVMVFDPANPFRGTLVVRGRAELVHDGADDHIDRLAKKYLGLDQYPWRRPDEQRVTVRVIAEKISGTV